MSKGRSKNVLKETSLRRCQKTS